MGWGFGFKSRLNDSSIKPKFVLQFLGMPFFEGDAFTIYGGFSTTEDLSISSRGPIVQGSSVIPSSWNVSFGGFTVPITGSPNKLFKTIRKGSIAQLFVILGGEKERVAIGYLKNIRGFGNSWNLEFADLLSCSRADGRKGSSTLPTGNDPDHFDFFYLVGKEALVTTNWHKTGSNFPDKLYVSDIRIFKQETGIDGIAKCRDSSGNDFYLAYSSVVSSGSAPAGYLQLTKVYSDTDVEYPSINSPTNLSTNDIITSVAILTDKPWTIFGKILLSRTGTSTNPFDKYPQSYNFGGYLATDLFDYGDANSQSYIKSSNSGTDYKWSMIITSPMKSLRDFVTKSSKSGQFPVWRQNSFSWRGSVNPNDIANIKHLITNRDIIRINSIDIFDPNQKSIFCRSVINYGVTSSSAVLQKSLTKSANQISSLPAESFIVRDNSYLYDFDPNTASTNRGHCADGDLSRLFVWDNNIWTKISMKVKLKYAQLCAGDIVEIESEYINIYSEAGQLNQRHRALIIAVDFDFVDCSCNLELAILAKD